LDFAADLFAAAVVLFLPFCVADFFLATTNRASTIKDNRIYGCVNVDRIHHG